jgi:hypothetical protein
MFLKKLLMRELLLEIAIFYLLMMLEFVLTFCCQLLLSSKTFYKHAIVLWQISAE